MGELAGRLAVVKASGSAVTMTDEATTATGNQVYQITHAAKRVLDRTAATVVKDDGAPTAEAYTLNRLNGTVTFVTQASRVITIDGEYLPMTVVATAYDYKYKRGVDLHDITAFLATHKARIAGQKWASGTLSQWDINDYFEDVLTAGEPIVLEFRGQEEGEPERVWALLEGTEMAAAIKDPQKAVVTFVSTDELLNL
jgi:hypothetical protein